MLVSRRNIYISILCALLVFFALQRNADAQETSYPTTTHALDKAEVQWLAEWPNELSKTQKKEIKEKIGNLLFGKKKQVFKRPVSLVAASETSFWTLDQESNTVFEIENNTASIPHFIDKKKSDFLSLVSICDFRDNEFLFTDSYSNKIFVFNPAKKECRSLNDSLKLKKITGISYSPLTKQIWLIETGEHRILILNEDGTLKKTIGKRGQGNGEFNFPTHLCLDQKGNCYVVDAMNFRVQVFNSNGDFISVFGKSGDATGYFSSPKGIATDSYGNIYVVDALFHVVQIFDINGNFLYSFGTQGQDKGQFWMPSGIYIDKADKIYVADSYNSRIQIFQLIAGGIK